ncbi:MAG: hypothetical protein FRX49_12042 [Trebouxia sp. A1-2]|nr:MAG: hypothetical protein FRX49_12042 [Trebouxia sp. A1-2]
MAYEHKSLVVQLRVEGPVYKVAHTELVENESMIHHTVKATVPHTVKSNPDVFGSVEEADAGWSFVKLQHLGSSLQAVPLRMLSSLLELCSSEVDGDYNDLLQHLLDAVLGFMADLRPGVRLEVQIALQDAVKDLLLALTPEGRHPTQQDV